MSKALGMRCVWGLCGVLVSVLVLSSAARAEVSSDFSGSVLVYPKVIWDSGRDTVIQLSNTSNNVVHAHCFYVNAQEFQGNPRWQVTDFHLWLTRQQPVHWVASNGRAVNPTDGIAGLETIKVLGAGIQTGIVVGQRGCCDQDIDGAR